MRALPNVPIGINLGLGKADDCSTHAYRPHLRSSTLTTIGEETAMNNSALASPQWITLGQAADILGVCTKTIRRRIAAGDLPAYKIGHRAIRIKIGDLDRISRRIPAARF